MTEKKTKPQPRNVIGKAEVTSTCHDMALYIKKFARYVEILEI